jgi:hypothetical protein
LPAPAYSPWMQPLVIMLASLLLLTLVSFQLVLKRRRDLNTYCGKCEKV